ncbi:hypothetical protein HDE_04197 [Halotydeus destructor]|nr:hypothetical protein HDE_04197 [Halotydeus destructor]
MATKLFLSIAVLLIVGQVNCDPIRHQELESAFIPWFSAAVMSDAELYQLAPGLTFASEPGDLDVDLNLSLQNISFTVGPITKVRHSVQNLFDGITVQFERPEPLDISFIATAVDLNSLVSYAVSGTLNKEQRVTLELHRARENNATLDLANVIWSRQDDGKVYSVNKDVQEILEHEKDTLWPAITVAATNYFTDLYANNDPTVLLNALHDLYKFSGVDIFNYY